MHQGTAMETLVVGVDGASREVLDPLFEDGAVPTLERLFRRGASGPLESQIPPWTASAWPSLYTGTNPGKHGVFGFLSFEGYEWDVVDASDVRQPPLWELADHHGLSSVVVNVPVTHPTRAFDGALVPGYTAPESPTCHPEGLLEEVRAALGGYRVYPEHTGETGVADDRIVQEHVELATMRGRAFRYLTDEFDPEFGFVQFQGTDSVIHELPGDREALRRVYMAVDEQLDVLLDACEPDTVVVASDHGVGPIGGHDVNVNDALREAGLLATKRGGRGMPTWAVTRDAALTEGEETRERGLAERVMAGLARVGLTSQRAAAVLERLGLVDAVARVLPTAAISAAAEQVDFRASEAYVRSRVECGVRLNRAGREPDGTVTEENYEPLRDQVVALLSAIETPTGEPVFEEVARRERFFEGPAVEDAPDVVAVPRTFDHLLSARLTGSVLGPPSEAWNHKREGVVAVAGDGVDPGVTPADAHLFDVAPTVLATLGLPAARRMDGDVLSPVEPLGRDDYPDVETVTRPADDTAAVEQRLADLGYLE
jgi:predicted AlkP superfamily phosphohydrolase/phosphomutase